jgi:hypothetical protein
LADFVALAKGAVAVALVLELAFGARAGAGLSSA